MDVMSGLRMKLDELKKLNEQRQAISADLFAKLSRALDKKQAALQQAAALQQKQASFKRQSQPLGLGAPEPKRVKTENDTDKRIADVWRGCASVIDFLLKKKNAMVFSRPVDPVRDGVPDYFKVRSCGRTQTAARSLPWSASHWPEDCAAHSQ
jgi:hypothetical protein